MAILTNLAVGLPVMLACLLIQAATVFWGVRYYIGCMSYSAGGDAVRVGFRPLALAMTLMTVGNLVQITLWGALFVWLGEFSELYDDVYHSGVNFTSLGYGDIVMSQRWKLLGPLEAVNGILMLGMSGAALMAMLQHTIKGQFERGRSAR